MNVSHTKRTIFSFDKHEKIIYVPRTVFLICCDPFMKVANSPRFSMSFQVMGKAAMARLKRSPLLGTDHSKGGGGLVCKKRGINLPVLYTSN
jgi:hypothetical protein